MDAFFAVGSAPAALRHLAGRRALLSFAYLDRFWTMADAVKLRAACIAMFLDSGAFTAWTRGTPIDLGAYLAFVEAHGAMWDHVAALDSIDDWRQSVANWRAMLDRSARPVVPVYHEGEPIEVLDDYVAGAPYVGIGRTEGRRSKRKTLELYDDVFNRHPTARLHAFGCADPECLEPYPWASFDSTTWERDSTYAAKHGWPWGRVSKATRMAAYVEATDGIEHRPPKQRTIMDAIRSTVAA